MNCIEADTKMDYYPNLLVDKLCDASLDFEYRISNLEKLYNDSISKVKEVKIIVDELRSLLVNSIEKEETKTKNLTFMEAFKYLMEGKSVHSVSKLKRLHVDLNNYEPSKYKPFFTIEDIQTTDWELVE